MTLDVQLEVGAAEAIAVGQKMDRAMCVRVVEELLIDLDDPRFPGLSWHPRTWSDGQDSRVGLLRTDQQPAEALQLVNLVDRREVLASLDQPRLLGICDGGGMVFIEGSDSGVWRRWVIFPLDSAGKFIS